MKTNVSMPHANCPACRKVYGDGPFTEEESQNIIIQFRLYEPCYIGGSRKGLPDFELILDNKDADSIVGFRMIIPDDDFKIKVASETAANFVNYLSRKTRTDVRHRHPEIIRIIRGKPFVTSTGTMKSTFRPRFDLNLSRLSPILVPTDPMLAKRLEHSRRGLAASIDNDWEEAFRNYYQVIENSGLKEEVDFKPLRHAVSHSKLDDAQTITVLQDKFGMKVLKGMPINFNDPDNLNHLQFYTHHLMTCADNYLDAELTKISL